MEDDPTTAVNDSGGGGDPEAAATAQEGDTQPESATPGQGETPTEDTGAAAEEDNNNATAVEAEPSDKPEAAEVAATATEEGEDQKDAKAEDAKDKEEQGENGKEEATASADDAAKKEEEEKAKAEEEEAKNQWTQDEDELLVEGLDIYGEDWEKIASWIKTRDATQTQTHFNELMAETPEASKKRVATRRPRPRAAKPPPSPPPKKKMTPASKKKKAAPKRKASATKASAPTKKTPTRKKGSAASRTTTSGRGERSMARAVRNMEDPWVFCEDSSASLDHVFNAVTLYGVDTMAYEFKERGKAGRVRSIKKLISAIDASVAESGYDANALVSALEQVRDGKSLYTFAEGAASAIKQAQKLIDEAAGGGGRSTRSSRGGGGGGAAATGRTRKTPVSAKKKKSKTKVDPFHFSDESASLFHVYHLASTIGKDKIGEKCSNRQKDREGYLVAKFVRTVDRSADQGCEVDALLLALERIRAGKDLYTFLDSNIMNASKEAATKLKGRGNGAKKDPWRFATDASVSLMHVFHTCSALGMDTMEEVFSKKFQGEKSKFVSRTSKIKKIVEAIEDSIDQGYDLGEFLEALEEVRGRKSIYSFAEELRTACRKAGKKLKPEEDFDEAPAGHRTVASPMVPMAPPDLAGGDPWSFVDDGNSSLQKVYDTVSHYGTNILKSVCAERGKAPTHAKRISKLVEAVDASRKRGFGLGAIISSLERVRGIKSIFTLADEIDSACETAEGLLSGGAAAEASPKKASSKRAAQSGASRTSKRRK